MPPQAAGLTVIVLGAAAGGGFPQWNCRCAQCNLARSGDPRARPATQASLAVSGDGISWIIIGASPDLRQQILQTPQLWPKEGLRGSPITAVVLLGGDIDAIAGLLVLRERQPFTVYAPVAVLSLLQQNPMFGVLDPAIVRQIPVDASQTVDCGANVKLSLFELPGKVPLYLEDASAAAPQPAPTYAAQFDANGRRAVIAPACADISDRVHRQLCQADLVFFDGTLFRDDEMITAGLGVKTGRRMGHVPLDGPGGTLERLTDLPARKVLLHINNSNPILLSDSAERRQVEAAGFEVAYDGMELRL
jgi:pyrroloquinoline quinone biosynthesis protein B